MEEYNLDRDNANYASSLQAYNNALLNQRALEAKATKAKDDAHDAWATPVELLSGDLAGKPIKNFVKKAGQNLVKKGLARGEEIVRDRAQQLGQRLADNVRARLPQGSQLSDAVNQYSSQAPDFTPAPASQPAPATVDPATSAPDVSVVPSSAPQVANAQPKDIDFQNVTANNFKDANQQLQTRFNALSREGQANVQTQYKQATNNLYNADKQPKDFNITDFRQRGDAMQTAIKNQEARETPDFDSSSLQTPSNISQSGAVTSSGEADSRVGGFLGDIESSGAQTASKVASTAGTTLEELGAGADATALAEGGLNPIADLVALGVGIAGMFGAAHKPPPAQIPFRPINPTLSHGI